MSAFYYVYVLLSMADKKFYTGYTQDLRSRIKQHESGAVPSTQNRRPLELVYYEACRNQTDAIRREKYLKSTWGKRYLRLRLANYLTG